MGKGKIFLNAKPRQIFYVEKEPEDDIEWGIPVSFFAQYRADNEHIINKCFEFDWNCSVLPKIIKDQERR